MKKKSPSLDFPNPHLLGKVCSIVELNILFVSLQDSNLTIISISWGRKKQLHMLVVKYDCLLSVLKIKKIYSQNIENSCFIYRVEQYKRL